MDEEKIVVTEVEYDLEVHKNILGRQFDADGNEFYYQHKPKLGFLKHHIHPYKWSDLTDE